MPRRQSNRRRRLAESFRNRALPDSWAGERFYPRSYRGHPVPRPHERVPQALDDAMWTSPEVRRRTWALTAPTILVTPSYFRALERPSGALSVVYPTPTPSRTYQRNVGAFRHVLALSRQPCVSRVERRRTLFAIGKAGYGKRKSPGPYHRTERSNISCR